HSTASSRSARRSERGPPLLHDGAAPPRACDDHDLPVHLRTDIGQLPAPAAQAFQPGAQARPPGPIGTEELLLTRDARGAARRAPGCTSADRPVLHAATLLALGPGRGCGEGLRRLP